MDTHMKAAAKRLLSLLLCSMLLCTSAFADDGAAVQRDAGTYTYVAAKDVAKELAQIFESICLTAMSDDEDGSIYTIWADEHMDVRVTEKDGDSYLSSSPMDFRGEAEFGHLSIVGEGKNQKTVTLTGGDYTVTLRGVSTGRGSYGITRLKGYGMKPVTLASAASFQTHPANVLRFDIHGDSCDMTDLSWEPLDHTETDPFTGKPTRGSETAASGRLNDKEKLRAWASGKAVELLSLNRGSYVQVLASDSGASWYLAAATDKDGKLCRGWLPAKAVSVDGYVPVLVRDPEKQYTVSQAAEVMNAPLSVASVGRKVKAGETMTAVHAERDYEGSEWVYVLLTGKKEQAGWIRCDCLEGWQSVSPEGFRIGYAMPTLIWQKTVGGNGFTEFMWAASQLDGTGTVLSGRTSTTSKPVTAKYKNRDAMALLLTPDGEIERSTVVGGTGDMDSFHCIVPVSDGFLVSGVTRSNDKDFAGIWDTATYSGQTKSKTKLANALIGKLNPDLSISWMKSFGSGDKSFGFDMVVETADGNIAGSGWLYENSKFKLRGIGRQDFLAVKLDRNGRVLSYQNYGGSSQDVPDAAVATKDGGLMLVGTIGNGTIGTGSTGRGDGVIFITDPDLRQTNRVTYGGNETDIFDNVIDLGDGSYLVTGFTGSYSSSMDFWAIQVDSLGRMIWSKTYGGSNKEEICGTKVLPNGNCLLVGYTTSTDGDVQGGTGKGKDAWALCIDQKGRILWQYTCCISGDDYFNSAAVDPADGGIVLCGTRDHKNDKTAKGFVVKIMPPAETLESRDYVLTDDQKAKYGYAPLDVVLVLDTSGSMASTAKGGQQIISLAQEAAMSFVETLFSLSIPSRIGLITFDSEAKYLTGGFMGSADETTLKQLIRNTQANGTTNTGGAFRLTKQLLDREKRDGVRRVVIMLTDGIPVGDGNPILDAIISGRALAGDDTLIYTVGLVGALSDSEKNTAREVLNDGYETRYFEVDNRVPEN